MPPGTPQKTSRVLAPTACSREEETPNMTISFVDECGQEQGGGGLRIQQRDWCLRYAN